MDASVRTVNVDDHGYIKFIEAWGHGEAGVENVIITEDVDYECGIIEAARQSTQASFRGWEQDQKLLEFLYSNRPKHTGPFEFAGMTIEVQAPICVFREWHRHRTQSYNEMSARYAPLPDLYYVPMLEDVMYRAHAETKNKQAKGMPGTNLSEANARWWLESLDAYYTQAETLYQRALEVGIPKELARLSMPVGHYSRMRATGNLLNWIRFMTLRMDPNAQAEIRRYAHIVGNFVMQYFPRTWSQFRLEQDRQ
jgi:thymidylate synthase (FAD)